MPASKGCVVVMDDTGTMNNITATDEERTALFLAYETATNYADEMYAAWREAAGDADRARHEYMLALGIKEGGRIIG